MKNKVIWILAFVVILAGISVFEILYVDKTITMLQETTNEIIEELETRSKTDEEILVNFKHLLKSTFVNFRQFLNALFSIVTMFEGILIACKLSQFLNALSAITVKFAFVLRTRLVAVSQYSNALFPIETNEFGKLIASSKLLRANALSPIVETLLVPIKVNVDDSVQP